jgi:hypothetical protein
MPTHAAARLRKKNFAKIEAWLTVSDAPKPAASK